MRARWILAFALAGLAALVLVFVVVLLVRDDGDNGSGDSTSGGNDAPPPEIPGEVLYQSGTNCLTRIRSGRSQEVCWPSIDIAGPLTWLDVNEVATIAAGGKPTAIDLVTGSERATDQVAGTAVHQQFPSVSPNLETVTVDDDGRVFIARGGPPSQVYHFDTDAFVPPEPIGWSPDSEWILFSFVPGAGQRELWVLKKDGSVAAVLADDLKSPFAAWRMDGVGVFPALVPFVGDRVP